MRPDPISVLVICVLLAGASPAAGQSAAAAIRAGQALEDAGKLDQAVAEYGRAIAADPASASGWLRRGIARIRAKQYEPALQDLDRSIRIDSSNAEAHKGRASALNGLRRFDEALAAATRAIDLRQGYSAAYQTRGFAKFGLRDYAGSVDDQNRAIRANPENWDAFRIRGIARVELKQYREAVPDLDRTIEAGIGGADMTHHYRGIARNALGDAKGAFEDANRTIELSPSYARGYLARGNYRLALGDRAGAEADYRKCLALDPEGKLGLSGLAKLGAGAPGGTATPAVSITPPSGGAAKKAAPLSKTWNQQMPYVRQGLGTCWAATARSLLMAYGSRIPIFQIVRDMRSHISLEDGGDGRYGLASDPEKYKALADLLNKYAPAAPFRSDDNQGFLYRNDFASVSTLLSAPLTGHLPAVFATAGHALLVLDGTMSGVTMTSIDTHDPRGTAPPDPAEGSLYFTRTSAQVKDQNMKGNPLRCKHCGVVLYPRVPPTSTFPLQTLTAPTPKVMAGASKATVYYKEIGYVRFTQDVRSKPAQGGKPGSRPQAFFWWDPSADAGYVWRELRVLQVGGRPGQNAEDLGRTLPELPPDYDALEYSLEVWNADKTSAPPVTVEATVKDASGRVVATRSSAPTPGLGTALQQRQSGPSYASGSLGPVCDWREPLLPRPLKIEFTLRGAGGRELDGFSASFALSPRPDVTAVTEMDSPGLAIRVQGTMLGTNAKGGGKVLVDGVPWIIERWNDREVVASAGLNVDVPSSAREVTIEVVPEENDICTPKPVRLTLGGRKTDRSAAPKPGAPGDKGGYWALEREWTEQPRLAPDGRVLMPGSQTPWARTYFSGSATAGKLTAICTVKGEPFPADCSGTLDYSIGGASKTITPGTALAFSGTVTGSGTQGANSPCGFNGWATFGSESLGGAPKTAQGGASVAVTSAKGPIAVKRPQSDRSADGSAPLTDLAVTLSGGNETCFVVLHRVYRWVPAVQR